LLLIFCFKNFLFSFHFKDFYFAFLVLLVFLHRFSSFVANCMLIHITGSFTCLLSREQKMGYDIGKHDGKQTDAEDFSNSAASQKLGN
jgi:hypothetical protein